jgi:FMN hydrolase / 5-amino-6-(5-phospho-D-ribitylamino)uracil phosphatase
MSPGDELFAGVAAISFDGDGTLWDFEAAMWAALERSARALTDAGLGRGVGPVDAEWLAAVRDEVAAEPRFAGASMEAIRLASFEEAVRRCDPGRLELAQPVYARYMEDRFSDLRPYDDVAGALSALRERFQLVLVTNGNTHPRRVRLERSFDEVVLAFECGIHKPDPGIYTLALETLGVEAAACVHVGDDPVEDVEAARRAGLRPVWINRTGAAWLASVDPPDAEVEDLNALLNLAR